ncbi:glycosyltransferase [Paraburkholderia tropica]|uniref:glycosyltransferase n=1 Tax=Paraburkholderia tropica TaxID=92647 RepID=UPI002AB29BF4|nr:glycosyltransferase [Paraburkholderia tropica]
MLTGIRLFCKKERVAIWIDVDPIVSSISLPALAFLKVRHISWEHFNFKNALGRRMRRLGRYMAAQFADAIVVLTKQDERLWLDALNPKARISVIYNPSPFDNVFNDHSRKDGRLIISIGRLIKLKGYDLLIDAWQLIRRDCANGWSVVVIGDGPEKPFLEQKIKALGLSETFLLVGRKNDVASYYEKADLFCLSSLAEGLPMVLIEAQAYGVPCVSFNCLTGPSEIIEHGVNGLLVDCGDVVGLANALRLMMEDQDMRTRMSSASIVAKRKFNRQDIIARWCRLFAEISHDK